MYTVSETLYFCYGHRLIGYQGKCAHAHGHNARVEFVMSAPSLDPLGMVADFDAISRIMGRWIDENLDHRMLLMKEDPLVAALRALGEPVYEMEASPTAEAIAKILFDAAAKSGLPVESVRLWETEQSVASYSAAR